MKRAILFLTSIPLLLTYFFATPAISMPIRDECPEDNPHEFVYAETHNFDIFICGGDFPHVYVGRAKNGSSEITLPLVRTRNSNSFVALNEDYPDIYRYVLTPAHLLVIKNGRTIVKESAKWRTR